MHEIQLSSSMIVKVRRLPFMDDGHRFNWVTYKNVYEYLTYEIDSPERIKRIEFSYLYRARDDNSVMLKGHKAFDSRCHEWEIIK